MSFFCEKEEMNDVSENETGLASEENCTVFELQVYVGSIIRRAEQLVWHVRNSARLETAK